MVKKIAVFNLKAGVGKTTTAFNLGWMLAEKGKRVILADTDPQCDLTGIILGVGTEYNKSRIEAIYKTGSNIKIGLAPALESQPRAIEAVNCIPIADRERLFLLPSHVGLAEYEVTLGIAQQLNGSIATLKNIPGAFTNLFHKTALKYNADYIIIDMSPGLSSINQNLLMTSDFFLVPTNVNFFSFMAIESLAKVLPRWYAWAMKASSLPILKDAIYPFPDVNLSFLGTIVQNYRTISGKETSDVQVWDKIEEVVSTKLAPVLEQNNMLLPKRVYSDQKIDDNFTLTKIPHFNSLITLSEEYITPIYALTPEQLGQVGVILKSNQDQQKEFRETFSELADKIIGLTTSHAVSAQSV